MSLRVLVIEGPGDAITSFDYWRRGEDNSEITSVAFSSQIYDACKELEANLLVIAPHERIENKIDGKISVSHIGNPLEGKSGILYHIENIMYAKQIAKIAKNFGADILVASNMPYLFLVRFFVAKNVKIVANLHCVLWPKFLPLHFPQRIINIFEGLFFRHFCFAVLSISNDINRQIKSLAGEKCAPIVNFLPLFRNQTFESVHALNPCVENFRVMYAGRIETNKGVFDILDIATELKQDSSKNVIFEICGDGSAFEELANEVKTRGMQDNFIMHGWCVQEKIVESYGRANVVIVPTTIEFIEGFNMVVVEAILAGRPVITSSVCPSVEYVEEAVVTVSPGDKQAYKNAIIKLAEDQTYFSSVQSKCQQVSEQFLDSSHSFAQAFKYVIKTSQLGETPRSGLVGSNDF